MINNFQIQLAAQIKAYWNDTLAGLGTPQDRIPDIFANLPADGNFGWNHATIRDIFTKLNSGNPQDDLTFILEFPAVRTHIPCISIQTGAEQEEEVVGAFVGQGFNDDTQLAFQMEGGPFVKQYSVGVHSFNADTTIYLFSLVKTAILILRQTLSDPANMHITVKPMIQDGQRFGGDVVYETYIDLTIEGLIDTAITNYDLVRNVVVNPIDLPDGDSVDD